MYIMDSANQLSHQIKSFIYNIKQDTFCKQSAGVWSIMRRIRPLLHQLLLSSAKWFPSYKCLTQSTHWHSYACPLHSIAVTRAHACMAFPQLILQKQDHTTSPLTAAMGLEVRWSSWWWCYCHCQSTSSDSLHLVSLVCCWRVCCQILTWQMTHLANLLTQIVSSMVSISNQVIYPQLNSICLWAEFVRLAFRLIPSIFLCACYPVLSYVDQLELLELTAVGKVSCMIHTKLGAVQCLV